MLTWQAVNSLQAPCIAPGMALGIVQSFLSSPASRQGLGEHVLHVLEPLFISSEYSVLATALVICDYVIATPKCSGFWDNTCLGFLLQVYIWAQQTDLPPPNLSLLCNWIPTKSRWKPHGLRGPLVVVQSLSDIQHFVSP